MKARTPLREWFRIIDLDLIAAFLVFGLLLLAFLELGEGPISLDERILRALRDPVDPSIGIGPEGFEGTMRDITALGSGTFAVLISVALVGWLLLTGRPGAALFVTIAMFGAWGLNELLKETFARERPTIVPHLMGASDPSYPSGHTMISAVLYPTMAELFGRLVDQRKLRFYLMGMAITVALLVAFSRVYLGVHYLSDVLGGLSMGFAWALVCGIVARVLQRHRVFRSRPLDSTEPPEGVPPEQEPRRM